jgi:DNA-binding NarL/FixJ family response regulator
MEAVVSKERPAMHITTNDRCELPLTELNLLVVEDDFATRRLLAAKLAVDLRIKVEVSATVAEALQWISQRVFDIILLDLGLPDGSGVDIVKAINSRDLPTKILVLSAMRDEASVVQAISAGAGGYVVKDAASEDILKAIHDLHVGFSPLSPSIARFILRSFRQQAEPEAKVRPDATEKVPVGKAQMFGLTSRENDVLLEITRGASYKQIAWNLSISEATVQSHIKNIYRKLGVSNRSEAAYRANN